ncbi:hypothetical protein HUS91_30055 [Pseudomonas chlororaphis]|uniref:hypothetical protein n=1 Tax=Pseudomonas chlororaphis TaxID=587753 RepID=UPI001B319838|nr:hypothetical protein [Pseudomonas chlororaphis]MBP5089734.1 hypothetical protein [Pseudomonas chlororaphis]
MNRSQSKSGTTENAETASAISVAQLCALTGYSPALISSLKGVLPEPFTVPTGSTKGGKPMQMYPLEQIAEFILDRTDFLTDAECRLRVALSANIRRPSSRSATAGGRDMFRLIDDAEGNHVVVPDDLTSLSPELRAMVKSAIAQEHADTRSRRCARRQIRSRSTTPEGPQL